MTMRSTAKLRDLRLARELPSRRPVSQSGRPERAVERPRPPRLRAPFRLWRVLDSLPMRAGRRLAGKIIGRAFELTAYVTIAAFIGLASAAYMIEAGSRLTVVRDGPWQRWTMAGSADADPYTRAHFARAGWLPLDSTAAIYFSASRDGAGEPLYSDCDYTVSGHGPAARRWTLTAYDMNGMLLGQGVGPAAVASDTALPGPGATVAITVSQATSSGNWLNVTGSSRMQLQLTLFGAQQNAAVKTAAAQAQHLFSIERTGCR